MFNLQEVESWSDFNQMMEENEGQDQSTGRLRNENSNHGSPDPYANDEFIRHLRQSIHDMSTVLYPSSSTKEDDGVGEEDEQIDNITHGRDIIMTNPDSPRVDDKKIDNEGDGDEQDSQVSLAELESQWLESKTRGNYNQECGESSANHLFSYETTKTYSLTPPPQHESKPIEIPPTNNIIQQEQKELHNNSSSSISNESKVESSGPIAGIPSLCDPIFVSNHIPGVQYTI